jgi:hypothetical protein
MDDTEINFDAPASIRKWPSISGQRVTTPRYKGPYLLFDGTLDECIRKFMSKSESSRNLYEIHTAPQGQFVTAVLSADHIIELVRLQDFL